VSDYTNETYGFQHVGSALEDALKAQEEDIFESMKQAEAALYAGDEDHALAVLRTIRERARDADGPLDSDRGESK
jgi:hypothetical protein